MAEIIMTTYTQLLVSWYFDHQYSSATCQMKNSIASQEKNKQVQQANILNAKH